MLARVLGLLLLVLLEEVVLLGVQARFQLAAVRAAGSAFAHGLFSRHLHDSLKKTDKRICERACMFCEGVCV